jgi:hypothetical protein
MTDEPRFDKLGRLLRELGAEKLDASFDARFWARLEKERSRRPAPRPAAPALVLAATGLAVLALAAARGLTPDRPRMVVPQGEVALARRGAPEVPAKAGEALGIRDRVRTDAGWAILESKGNYEMKVLPGTELDILRFKPAWFPGRAVFRVAKGAVLVSIDEDRRGSYPVRVLTPEIAAEARGTRFMVAAPAGGASAVRVLTGKVDVRPLAGKDAGRVSVAAGEEVTTRGGALLRPAAMVRARLDELEELFQFSRSDKAVLLIGMGPGRVSELLAPCSIYLRYEAASPAARELVAAVRSIQIASRDEDRALHLRAVRRLDAIARAETHPNRTPLLLFVGAYYRYLGENREAVRTFEEAVEGAPPGSGLRPLGLMAAARLRAEDFSDAEGARRLAERLLREHPDSPEREEAEALLGYPPAGPERSGPGLKPSQSEKSR